MSATIIENAAVTSTIEGVGQQRDDGNKAITNAGQPTSELNATADPVAAPTLPIDETSSSIPTTTPPIPPSAQQLYDSQTIAVVIQFWPVTAKAEETELDAAPAGQGYRQVLVGVRNEADPPLIRMCREEELIGESGLPEVLKGLLAELKAQLPDRYQQKLKQRQTQTTTTNTYPHRYYCAHYP